MKLNLPNRLTIARFIIALVIIILFVFPYEACGYSPLVIPTTTFTIIDIVCCVLFIIGSLTDLLDGKIARKRNIVTNFGKFMDPLADKFLVNSSLILLACYKSSYLPVVIVVLMLGRDLAVDGVRLIAATRGHVIAANIYGKLKTVVQMVVIPFIFLEGFPFNYLLHEYTYILMIVFASLALFFSLLSGIIYIYRGRDLILDAE